MKKSGAFVAAVAFLSTVFLGTTASASERMIPIAPVQPLPEARLNVQRLVSASLTTGDEAGTVRFTYAATFSNSCVAGATTVTPITIVETRDRGNRAPERSLKVALKGEWKTRIACPMIYKPVTKRYVTIVKNLSPGERYDAEILGFVNGRSLEVVAGR